MTDQAGSTYESHLATRYASRAMCELFSERRRIGIWRRIWHALAGCEREMGLPVTQAQVDALGRHLDDADLGRAAEYEHQLRHDVMAHVHLLKEQCPEAGPIVHLGATSCDVTDNADLIIMREALARIGLKLRGVMAQLRDFALRERGRACVAYTHYQPAQFTTVGKRAALWLHDFVADHEELEFVQSTLRFRGLKGATGTQDSFLKLFDGDQSRVVELERRFAQRLGFTDVVPVTGQTYSRKQDTRTLNLLSSIAQSAQKFAGDIRLLCHEMEIEEPFEAHQIGSSAMAYKRNPMRSERICSLARYLIVLSQNPAHTAGQQWLERTLDDSANRRLSLSEGFLAADAVLDLLLNVTRGLVVRERVIARHAREQLPLIASEEILMHAVRAGGDRQALHETIRKLSIAAQERVKDEGCPNDFLDRVGRDPLLSDTLSKLQGELVPERYVGRAADQVLAFVSERVDPILRGRDDGPLADEVRV